MQRYLLKGEVKQGMFPDERVLLFSDHQGRKFSTIVQEACVADENQGLGLVEVKVLQEQPDVSLVMLPGDVLDSSHAITVKNSELQPASRNGHH